MRLSLVQCRELITRLVRPVMWGRSMEVREGQEGKARSEMVWLKCWQVRREKDEQTNRQGREARERKQSRQEAG